MAAEVHEGALFVVGQIVTPTATSSERYVFVAKHYRASGSQLLAPTTFRGVSPDHETVNMARAIAARPDGTLLIAGQTNGSLESGQNLGRMDAFMAVFDAGSLTRSLLQQFGTTKFDRANGVTWDGDGNAIVVGETFGDLGGSNAGESNVFIARFDRFGGLSGYQQTGTGGYARVEGVAVDVNGQVFVTGMSGASSSFLSKGLPQLGP